MVKNIDFQWLVQMKLILIYTILAGILGYICYSVLVHLFVAWTKLHEKMIIHVHWCLIFFTLLHESNYLNKHGRHFTAFENCGSCHSSNAVLKFLRKFDEGYFVTLIIWTGCVWKKQF